MCGEHSSHKKLFESQLSDCPYFFYVCNFARSQDCSIAYHDHEWRFPDMELDIVLYLFFIFHVFFTMCLLALVDDQSSNKGGFIWSTGKMTTYWTNHTVKVLWQRNIVVFTTWPYIEFSIFIFLGRTIWNINPVWDTCACKRSVT